jgi:hypothetical protein
MRYGEAERRAKFDTGVERLLLARLLDDIGRAAVGMRRHELTHLKVRRAYVLRGTYLSGGLRSE